MNTPLPPHCGGHKHFKYDCIDCSDALERMRRGASPGDGTYTDEAALAKPAKVKLWIVIGRDGRPNEYTASYARKLAMERATESMMGYQDYDRLGTLSKRWAYCYRTGCRLVRATLTLDDQP